jgi:UDP-N-acetylglucosamine 4,6-dehydratase/5-epimerase
MTLNGKSVLVTGGTGSLGKKLVETILGQFNVTRLIVLSRDELKQFEMAQDFPETKYPCMRYFLGDVRDLDRMKKAFRRVDIVIHAAALKQVPAAEYNPFECIKTNVLGAQNVIDAALECGVKSVVALSTDKAAAPINLYGATKLCSDKLFVAANRIKGKNDIRFSVVRYGNVMGSRGSVIPFFMKKKHDGVVPVTDPDMTRFNISLEDGVAMVLYAVEHALGGEIFVPKIPSYRIIDVATAVAPQAKVEIVGIRPGEKMHEEMITTSDSLNTIDLGKYYAILPQWAPEIKKEYESRGGTMVQPGFCYNSGTNPEWLTVDKLSGLVRGLTSSNKRGRPLSEMPGILNAGVCPTDLTGVIVGKQ